MPYYEKAEDWLHQSALLLQARPSTTRITTRYHLKPARRIPKANKKQQDQQQQDASQTTPEQQSQSKSQSQSQAHNTDKEEKPPRGHLVLKTFDPRSGITLKYKTSKAAEVGRLVQMLGSLGKDMAGVKGQQQEEDVVMGDVSGAGAAGGGGLTPLEGEGSGVQTPVAAEKQVPQGSSGQGGAGGGGKGKKKKGKR
ncbi:hypothetical protein N658DRAFT_491525 [Parathielavia hyrcaniae]|uniref:SRP9 domain-containing protein n=1 Tax=Parathielavia hyrcaniae TaxID=113614 RepID=A0AAN6T6E9_9PEZI|nr:hypothetical protein N658DRAFT_491525 [Parathielavia hyrcaniae]